MLDTMTKKYLGEGPTLFVFLHLRTCKDVAMTDVNRLGMTGITYLFCCLFIFSAEVILPREGTVTFQPAP
mgnify:CR=1 FL=1